MAFSLERVADAEKYWRLLPLSQRSENELKLALMRHGLVLIDAKSYARDEIKNADDLILVKYSWPPVYRIEAV